MATPGREPVCPAQVKFARRSEGFMNRIQELVRFGKVFEDIGTNDKIIGSQSGDVVPVEIDLAERMVGDFRQEQISLISKGDLAAPLGQLTSEDAVSATEVKDRGFGIERYARLLDPLDRIIRLQSVEVGVVLVFEMMRDEL